MGKGLRSKIKKRWRKLRRDHVDNIVGHDKLNKIVETLNAVALGQEYREKEPLNAFLHPNQADSQFPQVKPAPIIDLRSIHIPGSGTEFSGGNRKPTNRTVTKAVTINQQIEEESDRPELEEVGEEEKMKEERATAIQSRKVRKNRKSKLRKTVVF